MARLATALLLRVIPPAAAAETGKPFERIALPNVGRITHLAPESASRVWLLSEGMDVLVVEGRTARTVRNGSWAFELHQPLTGLARVSKGDSWLVGPKTLFRTPVSANAK